MKVGRSDLKSVCSLLLKEGKKNGFLALDTETTGLKPYKGDRPFSLIIATDKESYYFNFQKYDGLNFDLYLNPLAHCEWLMPLFNEPSITWDISKAQFDMHMLWVEWKIELAGPIWCTVAQGRVLNNDARSLSLDTLLKEIGSTKNDTASAYITKHKLSELVSVPGKKTRERIKHYDRIPYEIISTYGEDDGSGASLLGISQRRRINAIAQGCPKRLPSLLDVSRNEARLSKTVFRMERTGIKIDKPFCVRAAQNEARRIDSAIDSFKKFTTRDFKSSPKLFAEVFSSERNKWVYTDKGNPSFESDTLKKFENPAAQTVIDYRNAKSNQNFYQGFIHFADSNDTVHPHLNPSGTVTGRFSSSEPNLQNLKKDEDDDLKQEFVVRRAFVPRPGFFFIMPDYAQMEYKMMLDYAMDIQKKISPLGERILAGDDFHQATADMVKELGITISRHQAKQGNFAALYGSGLKTLAETLGTNIDTARQVRRSIFSAAPEIENFIEAIKWKSQQRGFIFNWLGRRLNCTNPRFAYKMPNYIIQGGCADVNKVAMNRIDDYLLDKKSNLILCVHDENIVEVHESEREEVPEMVQKIMSEVFPHKFLPLTCDMEYSRKSLADKIKGFPNAI